MEENFSLKEELRLLGLSPVAFLVSCEDGASWEVVARTSWISLLERAIPGIGVPRRPQKWITQIWSNFSTRPYQECLHRGSQGISIVILRNLSVLGQRWRELSCAGKSGYAVLDAIQEYASNSYQKSNHQAMLRFTRNLALLCWSQLGTHDSPQAWRILERDHDDWLNPFDDYLWDL